MIIQLQIGMLVLQLQVKQLHDMCVISFICGQSFGTAGHHLQSFNASLYVYAAIPIFFLVA